jgi:uncharacterized protein (TIGR03067 family)
MRTLSLLLTAALALAAQAAPAPLPKPDSSKEDLKKLQGTWALVSRRGEPTFQIVIAGNLMKFPHPDDQWAITLDAKKKPKVWDSTGVRAGLKGVIFRGIYRLKGDTLTLCNRQGAAERDRPTEFAHKPGVLFRVYKRVKR